MPRVRLCIYTRGQFGKGRVSASVSIVVPSFEIMRTEVTTSMYRACVDAGACTEPNTGNFMNWSAPIGTKANHPINGISWYQAVAFANWVGARLLQTPNGSMQLEGDLDL